MCYELPVFSKCCCCFPLRPGLLVLGYFQLVSATLTFVGVLTGVYVQFGAKALAILFAVLGLLVANLIFSIIFVVGLHKKDYRLLKQYYSFNKFLVAVLILLLLYNFGLVLIYLGAATIFSSGIFNTLIYTLDILLQLYFLAVVKSLILKFKAEERNKYRNTNGEARVVLDMPITEEQDIKCDVELSDSDSESEEDIPKTSLFPLDELKNLQKDSQVQNTVEEDNKV